MKIEDQTVVQLIKAIENKAIVAKDCVEHFESETNRLKADINAFCEINVGVASVSQQDSGSRGLLLGIPVAVKDGICAKGFRTTACSAMLKEFRPPDDATVVSRLRSAGATILGKTNMDEFGMGGSTETSLFGCTKNPWDKSRVSGGSSGGSAAAIAAGMVPLALGSDTGGSIRQPAAFCGITGLKPTYGLVSRLGLIAFASSLDQIGPMGRTAEDVAVLLNVIAGHDPADSTSADQAIPDYTTSLKNNLSGKRIGVCKNQLETSVDRPIANSIRAAIQVFEKLGAQIVSIELPREKYAVAAYYVIAPCEASSNLSRYDGVRYTSRSESDRLTDMYAKTRSEYFGEEVKRRILLGTYALSAGYYDQYYLNASRIRRLIKQDYERAFEQVDFIAGPTTPTTAFEIGSQENDPIEMYKGDVFTVSANLAGIPALSIPCGFSDGLPIGLQLQGPHFSESTLLNAAHQFQLATDWHLQRPRL